MIEIKKKENCSGCHACYNICPQNCIKMKSDEEGFLYPNIDVDNCINCGMCEKVCPINDIYKGNLIGQAYACININDDIRNESSSGGIFSVIAEYVIENGGVVFGAAFRKDLSVHHISVTKKDELSKLRGSKYVQSKVGNAYKEVKDFLKEGKLVLFSGTPCQISGLKKYLGCSYDNLIMQDIVCHGVPSNLIWQKYLDYQKKRHKSNIKCFPNFRLKDGEWYNYKIRIEFEHNKKYCRFHDEDLYMKAFINNLCLRPSCYSCHSKSLERESDITLADFWGVDKVAPEMFDNQGTSLVFVNSKKGKELFEKISNKFKYKEIDIKTAVQYNVSSYKSVPYNKNRKLFMKNIMTNRFDKALRKYIRRDYILEMKVKLIRYYKNCKRGKFLWMK